MTSMIHYINVFTSCKRIKISKRAWLICKSSASSVHEPNLVLPREIFEELVPEITLDSPSITRLSHEAV